MAPAENPTLEPTLFSAGWRYRWLVLGSVAAGILLALFVYLARDTEYESTAVLLIDQPQPVTVGPAVDAGRYLEDQLQVMQSRIVIERAVERLAETGVSFTVREFNQQVSITGQGESDLITVTFSSDDPETAQSAANAVVEVYEFVQRESIDATTNAALAQTDSALAAVNEQIEALEADLNTARAVWTPSDIDAQVSEATNELSVLQDRLASSDAATDPIVVEALRSRIDDIRLQLDIFGLLRGLAAEDPAIATLERTQASLIDQRSELLSTRNALLIDAQLRSDGVEVSSPAPLGEAGNPTSVVRFGLVGVVLGAFAGLGLAYALAVRRRSFDHRSQPESVFVAPLLADIPEFEDEQSQSGLPVLHAPRSAAAEAYRFAAASLEITTRSSGRRAVAVISALNASGKTTASANLALAAARENHRVIVVDADFGDQRLSRLLFGNEVELQEGLTDVLAEDGDPLDRVQSVYVGNGARLSLIGRGLRPTLATDFFGKPEVSRIFDRLREEFDLVIIDTPPLLQIAYSSSILALADGAIAVVPHESLIAESEDLVARSSFVGTPIIGYLYNKAPLRREMTVTAGSMKDVVGDMGFVYTPQSRRKS